MSTPQSESQGCLGIGDTTFGVKTNVGEDVEQVLQQLRQSQDLYNLYGDDAARVNQYGGVFGLCQFCCGGSLSTLMATAAGRKKLEKTTKPLRYLTMDCTFHSGGLTKGSPLEDVLKGKFGLLWEKKKKKKARVRSARYCCCYCCKCDSCLRRLAAFIVDRSSGIVSMTLDVDNQYENQYDDNVDYDDDEHEDGNMIFPDDIFNQ